MMAARTVAKTMPSSSSLQASDGGGWLSCGSDLSHRQCLGKEHGVFQVDVAVEIVLEFKQSGEECAVESSVYMAKIAGNRIVSSFMRWLSISSAISVKTYPRKRNGTANGR